MKKILITLQNHKVSFFLYYSVFFSVDLFLFSVLSNLTWQSHSYPFLTPVSAEEVSDYYAVIANPMDLSKVGQKIANYEYPGFAEMKIDLDLIWSNCYAYNHDLVRFYEQFSSFFSPSRSHFVSHFLEFDLSTPCT
jgi:hypothetical protein